MLLGSFGGHRMGERFWGSASILSSGGGGGGGPGGLGARGGRRRSLW